MGVGPSKDGLVMMSSSRLYQYCPSQREKAVPTMGPLWANPLGKGGVQPCLPTSGRFIVPLINVLADSLISRGYRRNSMKRASVNRYGSMQNPSKILDTSYSYMYLKLRDQRDHVHKYGHASKIERWKYLPS